MVDEWIDLRCIAGWCESNILQHHEKCQFYAFRDVASGADRAEILLLPAPPPENHFNSNQICFYSKLGKVFALAEFHAKIFLTRNWVGGFYRDSLLNSSFLFSSLLVCSHSYLHDVSVYTVFHQLLCTFYHSLESQLIFNIEQRSQIIIHFFCFLNFDWLIYLEITACK